MLSGFYGGTLVLISPVPDHCLLLTLQEAEYAIVIEEDLDVSPDFFK